MRHCEIGPVSQWLPEVSLFDRRFLDPEWSNHLLPMPVTVEARQGNAFAFMVPYKSPCVETLTSDAEYGGSLRLERVFVKAIGQLPPYDDAQELASLDLRLRLDLSPGGRMEVPLVVMGGMTLASLGSGRPRGSARPTSGA